MTDQNASECVVAAVEAGRATVRPIGDFDIATAPHLDAALGALTTRGVEHYTIDLADVSFMDSAGLYPIVNLARRQPSATVSVINPSPIIRRLFQLHDAEPLMASAIA